MTTELIKTDEYLLLIDRKAKIPKGDYSALWIYDELSGELVPIPDEESYIEIMTVLNPVLVIAHLPLNKSPELKGVEFLSPLVTENEKLFTDADNYVRNKLRLKIRRDHEYILKNPQRYKDLFDGFVAGNKNNTNT